MRPDAFEIDGGVASEFQGQIPHVKAMALGELFSDPPLKQIGHEFNKQFDATELTKHWTGAQ